MATEQEILDEIAAVENMQRDIRTKLATARLAVIENESNLITANLKREKLQEQLRVWRDRSPIQPKDARDLDIEEFRKKVPELMKRIK